jgi:hypothetical protein
MEAVLMVAAVLFLALVFLGIPSLAKAIVRRKRLAAPPAHPRQRRSIDDTDWEWPR